MAARILSNVRRFEGSRDHCLAVERIASAMGIQNHYWVDGNTPVVTYLHGASDSLLWNRYRQWIVAGSPEKQEQLLNGWESRAAA